MTVLSIVVTSWNTREALRECLSSIRDAAGLADYEVIVVDNNSDDGSAEMTAADFPHYSLIRNEINGGFTRATNQGLQVCRGVYILLLNSDIVVRPGSIQRMLSLMNDNPAIGALSCRLLKSDGTPQFFCRRFPTLGTALFQNTFLERLFPRNRILSAYYMKEWKHDTFREVDQPPASCFMVRRGVVDDVGPLDEKMFLFYSDVDWCRRIRDKGYRIFFTPDASMVHHHGVATKKNDRAGILWHRDRLRYYRKHFGRLAAAAIKTALFVDFLARIVELCVCRIRRRIPAGEIAHNARYFLAVMLC